MNTTNPVVSVLMTAYNREAFIDDAIKSVLSSTLEDFELVIVDDCSKDNTMAIAQRYADIDPRVRLFVNEKNLGDYGNRNKAASYARGKYIKYLDSDDMMYPYTLQIMVGYMEAHPEAGYGLAANPNNEKPYPYLVSPRQAYLEHFQSEGHFDRAPGSAIIRRDAFEAVGGFTGERHIGDSKLWFTLGRTYPLLKIPGHLVWSRCHDASESAAEQARAEEYQRVRKALVEAALAHPDCPLTEEDKEALKKLSQKRARKTRFMNLIKSAIGS